MKSSPSLLAEQEFIKRLQRERVQCFSPCQAKSQIPAAFAWIMRFKGSIQKRSICVLHCRKEEGLNCKTCPQLQYWLYTMKKITRRICFYLSYSY